MNALEKYAAKKKLTKKMAKLIKRLRRGTPGSQKIALGLLGGGVGLTLMDPGGKVSELHKRYGEKYPVHVRGEK